MLPSEITHNANITLRNVWNLQSVGVDNAGNTLM